MGNSIKNIDDYAFSGCNGLESITCNNNIPPACGEGVFSGVPTKTCVLYVPEESIIYYRIVDGWKDFFNIEASGIEEVIADYRDDMPIEVYGANGVKVADGVEGLAPGVYILRQGSKSSKVIVK